MTSTGMINQAIHHLVPAAKVARYFKGPWWRIPCQLKYTNTMVAHAKGTVTFPVGAVNKGNKLNRLEKRMKRLMVPIT